MAPQGPNNPVQVDRVDTLIQYCLAVAAEGEPEERALGPIHLIKYVYLADLFFAEKNEGQTYTGVPWRFYHYGPWAEIVWERLEPAAYVIGVIPWVVESTYYENDIKRFRADQDVKAETFEASLPIDLALRLRNAIKEYRYFTPDLLHSVYATKPMLNAAPGDPLDFSSVVPEELPPIEPDQKELTKSQRERLAGLRQHLAAKKSKPKSKRRVPPPTSPNYDEAFYEALGVTEDAEGLPSDSKGELTFSPEVWNSRARRDVGSS